MTPVFWAEASLNVSSPHRWNIGSVQWPLLPYNDDRYTLIQTLFVDRGQIHFEGDCVCLVYSRLCDKMGLFNLITCLLESS